LSFQTLKGLSPLSLIGGSGGANSKEFYGLLGVSYNDLLLDFSLKMKVFVVWLFFDIFKGSSLSSS